jgi:response regulator NasT
MKNIIIAFSNPLLTNWASSILHRGGYNIEYTCKAAGDVVRVADFCTSTVVLCGYQFPDMTAEDLLNSLEGRLAMVTVLLSHQQPISERPDQLVVRYPVSAAELLQSIEIAERCAAFAAAALAAGNRGGIKSKQTERPAEEKLLILKAKELLIERYQMTESQAHRFLQKSSMDHGTKLIDSARLVLDDQLLP